MNRELEYYGTFRLYYEDESRNFRKIIKKINIVFIKTFNHIFLAFNFFVLFLFNTLIANISLNPTFFIVFFYNKILQLKYKLEK